MKKFYGPKRIIVAATVASKETVKILKDEEINDVEVITKLQSSSFNYVGQYYQDFAPVTDAQVIQSYEDKKSSSALECISYEPTCKEMLEYSNGYVTIHPKFTKLITTLRTVVEDGTVHWIRKQLATTTASMHLGFLCHSGTN